MVSTPVDFIFSSVSCWAVAGPMRPNATTSVTTNASIFVMGPPSVGENLGQELLAAVRLGRGEELLRRALLDHLALVHEDHAMGNAAGKSHFVRDAHHRHAVLGQRRHDV